MLLVLLVSHPASFLVLTPYVLCLKKNKHIQESIQWNSHCLLGWISQVSIGTDKTGFLQGNKLDSVNSRTTSIKLILHSHFLSKTIGGPDIWQQQYVLKLFLCLETSALFQ